MKILVREAFLFKGKRDLQNTPHKHIKKFVESLVTRL